MQLLGSSQLVFLLHVGALVLAQNCACAYPRSCCGSPIVQAALQAIMSKHKCSRNISNATDRAEAGASSDGWQITATEHDDRPDISFTIKQQHGSTAILAEDILGIVIPFLTVEPPAITSCDAKEACTPTFTTGGHIHVCCETCATLETPCTATHDECSDCRILRTMMQLSWRWTFFMWDYRTDLRIL